MDPPHPLVIIHDLIIHKARVCVCVCVCVWEKESKGESVLSLSQMHLVPLDEKHQAWALTAQATQTHAGKTLAPFPIKLYNNESFKYSKMNINY